MAAWGFSIWCDTTLTVDQLTTLYRKRWNVEPYHKSLKQNASLEKSPTQTVTTQANHLFAALCAYINLEWLRKATKLNHFALKTKLYVAALHSAYATLRQFHSIYWLSSHRFASLDQLFPRQNLEIFQSALHEKLTLARFREWAADIRSHNQLRYPNNPKIYPLYDDLRAGIERNLKNFEARFFAPHA